MIVAAPAKVNLTLEVLGRRPDGYHEIRSVLRTLALHDTLRIEPANALSLECAQAELAGPQNLVYRAALLLQQATGERRGARMVLEKAIPVAAGLGGGSSDAAAALLGLDALWGTGLDRTALAGLGAQLGSDVPFFLYGGTALAAGRGERIQPLPSLPDCPVLLVHPPLAVSTAAIYGAVTARDYGDGTISERLAALPAGMPPASWPMVNALQPITGALYPQVGEILGALRESGAIQAQMCGSGPTCFALFEDQGAAETAAAAMRGHGWESWVTRFG